MFPSGEKPGSGANEVSGVYCSRERQWKIGLPFIQKSTGNAFCSFKMLHFLRVGPAPNELLLRERVMQGDDRQ